MQRIVDKITKIREAALYVQQWQGAMYFVDAVGAYMIDYYVRKMREVSKEDELSKFPAIQKSIDRLNEMSANMQERLWKDYSKGMNVATHRWMRHYEAEYISLARLFQAAAQKYADTHKHGIAMMENNATVCSINQKNNISPKLVTLCILTASWSEMVQKFNMIIMGNWRKIMGKCKQADAKAVMYANIAKTMHKVAENLAYNTCHIDTNKHVWWEQYHQQEDSLFSELAKLLENQKFSDMLIEYATDDWLNYYIGRSVMDAKQNEGKTPRAVKVEVAELARWGKKPMAQAYDKMVAEICQALPTIEDPWEVAEYIEEHPYKVVDTLKELNISRVRLT